MKNLSVIIFSYLFCNTAFAGYIDSPTANLMNPAPHYNGYEWQHHITKVQCYDTTFIFGKNLRRATKDGIPLIRTRFMGQLAFRDAKTGNIYGFVRGGFLESNGLIAIDVSYGGTYPQMFECQGEVVAQ